MDSGDVWSARVATKQSQLLQAQFLIDRHLNTDDGEADEDVRTDFACPYCDEELDIISLCTHLEEDHCFDGKLSMCPVCAARVGSDVIGHISAQHAHLFKVPRKRRFRKPRDFSPNLQSLLGGARSTTATDSFLSSLVSASAEAEEAKPELTLLDAMADSEPQVSLETALSSEEREKRTKQAACRAEFVQHLILSTLWSSDS